MTFMLFGTLGPSLSELAVFSCWPGRDRNDRRFRAPAFHFPITHRSVVLWCVMANSAASHGETLRPETWHPTIRALYDYWVSVHPPGGLPGRQHIDPIAIPRLLPHLFMVDVSRDPIDRKSVV